MDAHVIEVARELGLRPEQVDRTLSLTADGATVPFVARYRKEATGGLDEVRIQAALDAVRRRRDLEERRTAVLASIEEQGRLTPELARAPGRRPDADRARRPVPALPAAPPDPGDGGQGAGAGAAGRPAVTAGRDR